MSRRAFALLAAALAFAPGLALAAEPCPRQPMPPPLSGAGFGPADRAAETIRFSAAPSLHRKAYAVDISRRREGGATIRLVKLARRYDCNLYNVEKRWSFRLSREEAADFFSRLGRLESAWRPPDEIVVDGTSFQYEHHAAGAVREIRLSNSARGVSGEISALILSLVQRSETRGHIPASPEWRLYSDPSRPRLQRHSPRLF